MPVPPCGNYGDINDDGNITTTDAMMVAQYVAGDGTLTPDQLKRADVDGDGKVTNDDALLISQYAVGNIDTFPVCSQLEKVVLFIIPSTATLKVDGVEVI